MPKADSSDIAKLAQVVLDMKVEVGIMLRAMTKAGTSFEQKEQAVNGRQKGNFVETAKK